MALVGTKEISGTEYEIHASREGAWTIKEPDFTDAEGKLVKSSVIGYGDTLDKAVQHVRQTLSRRSVKVNVPFLDEEGNELVATGIHSRNKTLLYRDKRGKSQNGSQYRHNGFKPETPQKDLADYRAIKDDIAELTAIIRDIEKQWQFDVLDAVKVAVNEAVKE
jgi:hypothetical protein